MSYKVIDEKWIQFSLDEAQKKRFQKMGYVKGAQVPVSEIGLPNNILRLVADEDCFYFLTVDDLYSVKFQQWRGISSIIGNVNHGSSEHYNESKWPYRKAAQPFLDIQATKIGLFALSSTPDDRFVIYRWVRDHDGIEDTPTTIHVSGIPVSIFREKEIRFLIASSEKQSTLMLYGLKSRLVFIGRFQKGANEVTLEEQPLINRHFNQNPMFIFALKNNVIPEESKRLEFWGIDTNNKTIFQYQYSLSGAKKSESKLFIDFKPGFVPVGFDFAAITGMAVSSATIFIDHLKSNNAKKEFIFLSAKVPATIYAIYINTSRIYHTIDFLGDQERDTGKRQDMLDVSYKTVVNEVLVAFNRYFLFGDSDNEEWYAYELPYYETEKLNTEKVRKPEKATDGIDS